MKMGHINTGVNLGRTRHLHLWREDTRENIDKDLGKEEDRIIMVSLQGDMILDKETRVAMTDTPEEEMIIEEGVVLGIETKDMARINTRTAICFAPGVGTKIIGRGIVF